MSDPHDPGGLTKYGISQLAKAELAALKVPIWARLSSDGVAVRVIPHG